MSWTVTVLGANSAVPSVTRHPSGQVISLVGENILIDCGEGSQVRMMEYGIRNMKISTILISHLHGDHIFGLPGLLTSYNLFHRKHALRILGPPGLKAFVDYTMSITRHDFTYPIDVVEINHAGRETILDEPGFHIDAFPLVHRIETYGYLIREKILRTYLSREKVKSLNLTSRQVRDVLRGETIRQDGTDINLSDIERTPIPRSYAYVSDTAYFPECADYIGQVRLLYHESTFLDSEQEKARERFHSTAREAARTAADAGVDHLLLGHYSSRYSDLNTFKSEAETVFRPASLAMSGKAFTIPSEGPITEESVISPEKI